VPVLPLQDLVAAAAGPGPSYEDPAKRLTWAGSVHADCTRRNHVPASTSSTSSTSSTAGHLRSVLQLMAGVRPSDLATWQPRALSNLLYAAAVYADAWVQLAQVSASSRTQVAAAWELWQAAFVRLSQHPLTELESALDVQGHTQIYLAHMELSELSTELMLKTKDVAGAGEDSSWAMPLAARWLGTLQQQAHEMTALLGACSVYWVQSQAGCAGSVSKSQKELAAAVQQLGMGGEVLLEASLPVDLGSGHHAHVDRQVGQAPGADDVTTHAGGPAAAAGAGVSSAAAAAAADIRVDVLWRGPHEEQRQGGRTAAGNTVVFEFDGDTHFVWFFPDHEPGSGDTHSRSSSAGSSNSNDSGGGCTVAPDTSSSQGNARTRVAIPTLTTPLASWPLLPADAVHPDGPTLLRQRQLGRRCAWAAVPWQHWVALSGEEGARRAYVGALVRGAMGSDGSA